MTSPTTTSEHVTADDTMPSTATRDTSKQRRALSKADWTTFRGTINMTTVNADLPINATVPKAFHLIHIPKSAGDSVMQDSPAHMAVGQTLKGNKELPYYATVHSRQFWNDPDDQQRALVFLRDPTSHVFSQFLECKYDTWGQGKTNGTEFPGFGELDDVMAGFDDWVAHFANTTASHTADYIQHGRNPQSFAYNCYDPWNMQARYMTLNNDTFFPNVHFVPTAEHARHPPLQVAMANLHNPNLILGITSYYAASICLLEYHALGGQLLTEACRTCDANGKLALTRDQHHDKHGVPPHSTKMITNPTTQHYIQQMTRIDQELYEYALDLFAQELAVVQNTTGMDLTCGRPIKVAPTTTKIIRGFGMAPKQKNVDVTPMLVILALAYGYYWRCCFRTTKKSRNNSITTLKRGNSSSSKSELSLSYRALSVSEEGDDVV